MKVKTAAIITAALLAIFCNGCMLGYPGQLAAGMEFNPPVPTKEIQNNLANGWTVQVTDGHGFDRQIPSGNSTAYKLPTYFRQDICLLAKVRDENGKYVGVATLTFYPPDCTPWIINYFEAQQQPPPTLAP